MQGTTGLILNIRQNKTGLLGASLAAMFCVALALVITYGLKKHESVQHEKQLEQLKHYHVYLRKKVSDLNALPSKQFYIGNFNLTLFDAVQDVQNDFFDSVDIKPNNQQIAIRIAIPENIADSEIPDFISFQALNYILILNKFIPKNNFLRIDFIGFRRGAYTNEMLQTYDFKGLSSSEVKGYDIKAINSFLIKN